MTIEERVQKGISYFKQGYNCAQSVVLAFAEDYELEEAFAAHISGSFGGGIGRMRETCGTACGMFMLAGLEVKGDYPDQELKKKNYEVVQRLAADFKAETGSLICKELNLARMNTTRNARASAWWRPPFGFTANT